MHGTKSSLLDRISSMSDEPVQAWKPQVGDTLVGKVVLVDSRVSQFTGKEEPVLHVEDERTGKVVAVYASTQVLRDEIIKRAPQIGEEIAIKRQSDGRSARHTYARFALLVDRDESQERFNWSRFGTSNTSTAPSVELYEKRPDISPSYDTFEMPKQDDDSDLPF